MKTYFRQIFLAVFAVVLVLIGSQAIADSTSSSGTSADVFADPDYKNSSLLQHQSYKKKYGITGFDNCFSTGKIIWNPGELNVTYMPGTITRGNLAPGGTADSILTTVGYGFGLAAASFFLTPVVGIAALLGVWLVMADVCTNSYIVAPHEYYNQKAGFTCSYVDSIATYDTKTGTEPLTVDDIPFFYHCNPLYDPFGGSSGTMLDLSTEEGAQMAGRTYGYMGSGSQYCMDPMLQYGQDAESSNLVGRVVFEYTPNITALFNNSNCAPDSRRHRTIFSTLDGENRTTINLISFRSYYKTFDDGHIQMCIAATSLPFPVRAACGSVAPPGDSVEIDPILRAYVENTRCQYLIEERSDLKNLGKNLSPDDGTGIGKTAVLKFLQSDFHITSTVVGCIKDMLIKVFVNSSSSAPSFFQTVQGRISQIVLAILVLFVSISGFKIMTSPEPPKKGEVIMMIVKMSLVVYFALGPAFYEVDKDGKVQGLFPQLLNVSDEIANLFLQAQTGLEAIPYCSYNYNGQNLLGETMYTGATTNTIGQDGVKLTLWDLVDCKIINYLNVGSCNYSPAGIVMFWLVSMSFWAGGAGLLLSIASFIYSFMLMLVIFKYAHTFILAMITVTILIFLAPIFVPFALFEATKGIFQKWMSTILGYILYPALLFAFLAIMFSTFDSLYYGNLNLAAGTSTSGSTIDVSKACQDVDSVYCIAMSDMSITSQSDVCSLSDASLSAWKTTEKKPLIGRVKSIDGPKAKQLLPVVAKLMLFTILFYIFMSSVEQFVAALLSVQSIGSSNMGSINLMNAGSSVAKAAGQVGLGIGKGAVNIGKKMVGRR